MMKQICVFALTGVLGVASLWGATWYVSPSGADTNDGTSWATAFLTPAKGVQSAASGDTVILAKGTYALSSVLGLGSKALTLRGETDNPRDVVLDGQGTCRGIEMNSGTGATVAALTVSNCVVGASESWNQVGSGISLCPAAASVPTPQEGEPFNLATNCVVTCCGHRNGTMQASLLVDAAARAIDCQITLCTNRNAGVSAAVVMKNGGELVNCTVENNEGSSADTIYGSIGAGIAGWVSSANATSMVIRACIVRGNHGRLGGGVVNVPTVRDCVIEDNAAALGGGLYYSSNFNNSFGNAFRVTVSNTVFKGNAAAADYASGYGGAIAWQEYACVTNFVVDSCVFTSNVTATADGYGGQHGGGAIYMRVNGLGTNVVIRNSLFERNRQLDGGQSKAGAAVYLVPGITNHMENLRLENCTFVGNVNSSGSDVSVLLNRIAVTNCVFASNLNKDGTVKHGLSCVVDRLAYSCFYPALTSTPPATNLNGVDPKFQTGSWIPRASSPLRDAGVALPWMTGTYDLQRDEVGRPIRDRIVGTAPDIGCYEYMARLGMMLFVR